MAQLYIPAQKEIEGPWLIGANELESLDEIFEYINTKLIESKDIEINEKARISLEKGGYKDLETAIAKTKEQFEYKVSEKKVKIKSNDNKELTDDSIKGILIDPKLKDFKPRQLLLTVNHGALSVKNSFSLNIGGYSGDVSYRVDCYDQNCRDEIKYKIESWLEKYQPNKPTQIWSEYSVAFIPIT